MQAIYAALRARFGLSPREARSRLSVLKKDFRTPLQEHAAEVERLVNIPYADLLQEHRASMRIETFGNTLGYLPLQRHLLAVHTPTLEDAVRAGNEFLQIRPANEKGSTSVRQIEDEEEEEDLNPTDKVLTTLMKAMQQLMEKVGQLPHPLLNQPRKGTRQRSACAGNVGRADTSRGIVPTKRQHRSQRHQLWETGQAHQSRAFCCWQMVTPHKEESETDEPAGKAS